MVIFADNSALIEEFNLPDTYEFKTENIDRRNFFMRNVSNDSLDHFICQIHTSYIDSIGYDTTISYCIYPINRKLEIDYLERHPNYYFENVHKLRLFTYTYRSHARYIRKKEYKGLFKDEFQFNRVYCN